METKQHDLLIIGAGPGGYVAAIRASQLGMDVGIIEKADVPGGTCLRVGCIPSKALLESSEKFIEARESLKDHGVKIGSLELDLSVMQKRKEKIVLMLTKGVAGLFKKNKITAYQGAARFDSATRVLVSGADGDATNETAIEAKNIIIAVGSKTAPLQGVELDGDKIGTSTEALSYLEVPQHLIVIGAGYIGLELGTVWKRLGAKVTVLEYLDRILPGMDAEIASEAHTIFQKQGIEFRLGAKVLGARVEGENCVVEIENSEPITGDRVLLAVGRAPNIEGLELEKIGVKLDARGRIEVDGNYATNLPNVFAIGDVIAGPMLAHKASEEGMACVEKIVTGYGHVNYQTIPGVCYTNPEIASVGQTEEQLAEAGTKYKKGSFPFQGNGRARALNDTSGRVKILADAQTDRVLGVHIIGPRAGDLIAEAVAAMEFGASSEDIARTCHAHPTLSEAVHEAALAVDGRAIHI